VFRDLKVAVVIPCYGVSRHIVDVVRTLPDLVDRVVLVDDGSPDDLAGAVGALLSERIVLLRHPTNQGLARAMVTGFQKAIALGVDVVVKLDGDGQMDPAQMPRLLAPIASGDADFAKGNRFVHRRHLHGMPTLRLLGNLGLSFMTKAASGYWHIFDPTNGYLALRRELLEEMDLDRLGPHYFFECSLLVEAYHAGAVVRDVAIPSQYGSEESSLSVVHTAIDFPFRLAHAFARRILLRYFLRDFTPVALFLLAGVALTGFGLGFGLYSWFERMGTNQVTPTGTIIVAALPLLVGTELLIQATVMDIGGAPTKSRWADRR
jgi:glycosyltransferase involved in cell wall biosynthesis